MKLDTDAVASVVVLAMKNAVAPLQERVAVLERDNADLRARVLELEAAGAARAGVPA